MKAHVLIVADGRSPTALSWIGQVQALDYGVSLISTFPCERPDGVLHFQILPVAFSRFSGRGAAPVGEPRSTSQPSTMKRLVRRFAALLQRVRYVLGPLTLRRFTTQYLALVRKIRPDLVHALRIPFEGMLAAATPAEIPLLVATWGNDLTLHATGSSWMRPATRRCLARADGLTSDTHRDVHLAREWGLRTDAPALVVPGSGGLDLARIEKAANFSAEAFGIPEDSAWVVNPRGIRPGSVHQKTFFAAIPKVLAARPDTIFLCPSLGGVKRAEAWVSRYGIEQQAFLLPKLPQADLWGLFKKAAVFVSPSSHDGTPNTLLEALACGCFPVAGAIESLQEWIESGVNGLLVDPRDPDALAAAILEALNSPDLRQKAAERNRTLLQERAAQSTTRPLIDAFYRQFLH